MDEILNTFVEEIIEMPVEEVVETEPIIEDVDNNPEVDEIVEDVEAEAIEEIEVEMDEAIGWSGADGKTHSGLPDRNSPNQHLITSITGLKERLDNIEALKVIESNKLNVANYYKWADNKAYDTYGYFVSMVPDEPTITIKICDGSDILGVSVNDAGFVGGQNDIKRDNTYGLIVTSGLVGVRCELDVKVEDHVVSDAQGYAKKSGSNYGYKVLDLVYDETNGETYAIISLGVQADKMNLLGLELSATKEQVKANDKNITSAINVANQAYNKASEIGVSNQEMSNKVDEALDIVDRVTSDVESLETQVLNSAVVSAQAKAIAESAATSAASMKNEAVEEANKALTETSELRKEFEAKATEIDAELDNAALELEATKEEFNSTINNLKLDTEGQLADFKKEVSDNYATTIQLAAVKTETSDAIAAVKQEASDTYATIESVVALQTETSESIAGFKQEVSETYATQEMLTSLETDTGKALTDYKQEVAETYATQEMVSKLETNTTKTLTDYKQEVTDTYATQEMVAKLETDTSKALSDYKQEVGNTYATNTSLANLKTETTNAIAASEEKATNTYVSKSDLTSFESQTNIAMARIEQKADANGAYIQSTVSNMDKYSVGPHSQAYGFTLEQAASVLEESMIYVPTESVAEEYNYTDENGEIQVYTRTFTPQYLYKWGKIDGQYRWITVDKNYTETDETNTSSKAVYFTPNKPAVAGNFGYWYTDGDTVTEGYAPYTLYKWESYVGENGATQYCWVAVATLAGNSQSRAVSQIRQDANSIELSVTTLDGKYAGTKAFIDDNQSVLQDVVSWKGENGENIASFATNAEDNFASASQVAKIVDKDGNIKAASIVTAVNGADSSVVIDADRINLDTKMFTVRDKANSNDVLLSAGNGQATIGGFTVDKDSISNNKTSYDDSNNGVYLGLDGIGLGEKKFTVNNSGYFTSTFGKIGNWDITDSSIESVTSTDDGTITSKVALINQDDYYNPDKEIQVPADVFVVETTINGVTTWPFYLWKDGSLYCSKLNATGGEIGNWLLYTEGENHSRLCTMSTDNTGVGMATSSYYGDPAFWAGCSRASPWDCVKNGEHWTSNTKFYVTQDGHVKASDVDFTGAQIAGWSVTSNSLASPATYKGYDDNGNYTSQIALYPNQVEEIEAYSDGQVRSTYTASWNTIISASNTVNSKQSRNIPYLTPEGKQGTMHVTSGLIDSYTVGEGVSSLSVSSISTEGIVASGATALPSGQFQVNFVNATGGYVSRWLVFKCGVLVGIYKEKQSGITDYALVTYDYDGLS